MLQSAIQKQPTEAHQVLSADVLRDFMRRGQMELRTGAASPPTPASPPPSLHFQAIGLSPSSLSLARSQQPEL